MTLNNLGTLCLLVHAIIPELSKLGSDDSSVHDFTCNIVIVDSARILLNKSDEDEGSGVTCELKRQPKGQFQHYSAKLPVVVFELSCLQDSRRLSRIVKEYVTIHTATSKPLFRVKNSNAVDLNFEKTFDAQAYDILRHHAGLQADQSICHSPFIPPKVGQPILTAN
ncbi:unnamed protein product [Fusarium graminearum]|uniref:Uncharacterized protein n=1 Tax=Gibberella zeae TaxID=5518 RepID=A0A9N8RMQ4_GIBZA|nr:unnamed protein product [Fusarium graminearum]